MSSAFTLAAFWLGLAVLATILANRLRISTALVEICVGIAAGTVATYFLGPESLGTRTEWVRFLAVTGAVLLTFLAGAELEPSVLRAKWKEVAVVGVAGFLAPFLGCTALARYALGWDILASWLAGVALSSTSMTIVYAVMLEAGFNRTDFGKGVLGACFVSNLGTVLALGLIFAPFTIKTAVFLGVSAVVLVALPSVTAWLTRHYAYRTAAIRTRWVLLILFGLGALALWSGGEAVLPAYIAGVALASAAARDQNWVRRLRTLTVGLVTPFYFIRAGALVSVPAIFAAPAVFLILLSGKIASKIFGVYPAVRRFRRDPRERWYYTLLMSTGLTFGTISALYGLSHDIITEDQYSALVAVVIAGAVLPTLVANAFFLPRRLLKVMLDEGDELGSGDAPAGDARVGKSGKDPGSTESP